jgi:hypothetical protein
MSCNKNYVSEIMYQVFTCKVRYYGASAVHHKQLELVYDAIKCTLFQRFVSSEHGFQKYG